MYVQKGPSPHFLLVVFPAILATATPILLVLCQMHSNSNLFHLLCYFVLAMLLGVNVVLQMPLFLPIWLLNNDYSNQLNANLPFLLDWLIGWVSTPSCFSMRLLVWIKWFRSPFLRHLKWISGKCQHSPTLPCIFVALTAGRVSLNLMPVFLCCAGLRLFLPRLANSFGFVFCLV